MQQHSQLNITIIRRGKAAPAGHRNKKMKVKWQLSQCHLLKLHIWE